MEHGNRRRYRVNLVNALPHVRVARRASEENVSESIRPLNRWVNGAAAIVAIVLIGAAVVAPRTRNCSS